MNNQRIAKRLINVVKDIIASNRQGFNLPRKPEKIIQLMKDNGFVGKYSFVFYLKCSFMERRDC